MILSVGIHDADAAAAKPPQARLIVTQIPTPPLTVRADASASTNRGSTPITSYRFDFGDGSSIAVQSASNPIATHTYAAAGTYTVLVTAVNSANLTNTASASIVVVP